MKDLTGQKFGRLTVIEKTTKRSLRGEIIWRCRCKCGNITEVRSSNLLRGYTKSCGCLYKETRGKTNFKHGDAKHGRGERLARLYIIWASMKYRCQNPNNRQYKWYGGKGIKVCDEWKNNYLAFKTWALSNGYDEELCLGRADTDGDYCPENCQWETKSEVSRKVNRTRFLNFVKLS